MTLRCKLHASKHLWYDLRDRQQDNTQSLSRADATSKGVAETMLGTVIAILRDSEQKLSIRFLVHMHALNLIHQAAEFCSAIFSNRSKSERQTLREKHQIAFEDVKEICGMLLSVGGTCFEILISHQDIKFQVELVEILLIISSTKVLAVVNHDLTHRSAKMLPSQHFPSTCMISFHQFDLLFLSPIA